MSSLHSSRCLQIPSLNSLIMSLIVLLNSMLWMCFHVGNCASLKENNSDKLIYLNSWYPVGWTVWGSDDVALLKEAFNLMLKKIIPQFPVNSLCLLSSRNVNSQLFLPPSPCWAILYSNPLQPQAQLFYFLCKFPQVKVFITTIEQ